MQILFATSHLRAGGAERVLSVLANEWASAGHHVSLLTLSSTERDFYDLLPTVERIGLDLEADSGHAPEALSRNLCRVRAVRRAIRETSPEVICSFQTSTNVLCLVASVGLKVPVVVSERNEPHKAPPRTPWGWLRGITYRRASALVVLAEAFRPWAEQFVEPSRVHVIPNPVTPKEGDEVDPRPSWPVVGLDRHAGEDADAPEKVAVAMGRLDPQKGFDLLIRAFARCESPGWKLLIFGEGPERSSLEMLIGSLGLTDKIILAGLTRDVYRVFGFSDLFVLSSRWEGFPNVLLEAMAAGLPVVATDCSAGVREILGEELAARLVCPGDVEELAHEMTRLMRDEAERRQLAVYASRAVERFRADLVMPRWEQLFARLRSGAMS